MASQAAAREIVPTNHDAESPSQQQYRVARSRHKGRVSHEDQEIIGHASFLFQVVHLEQWKEAIHGYFTFQEIMTTVLVSNGKLGLTQTLLGHHSVRRTVCSTLIS